MGHPTSPWYVPPVTGLGYITWLSHSLVSSIFQTWDWWDVPWDPKAPWDNGTSENILQQSRTTLQCQDFIQEKWRGTNPNFGRRHSSITFLNCILFWKTLKYKEHKTVMNCFILGKKVCTYICNLNTGRFRKLQWGQIPPSS